MSLSHLSNVKLFTFQYQYHGQDGLSTKYVIFDNLLNGIKFIYTLKISKILASDEISIYNKDTKKKIIKGDINIIYDTYLKTYPNSEYIDVLALLEVLNLDIYSNLVDNLTIRQIMKINSDYLKSI